MSAGSTFKERMRGYVKDYDPTYEPTDEQLETAMARSDRHAEAHWYNCIEAGRDCGLKASECGERMAASEIVECG